MTNEQTNKKRRKGWVALWITLLLAIIIAGIAVFWEYLPYNQTAARQLVKTLESYGIQVNTLEVERLNQSEVLLNNIQLGSNPGFSIEHIRAGYAITGIDTFNLNTVAANNVKAHVYRQDGAVLVSGLEPLMQQPKEPNAASPIFNAQKLTDILPQTFQAENVQLSGRDERWWFDTIAAIDATTQESIALHATAPAFEGAYGDYLVSATNIDIAATLLAETEQWSATLKAADVNLTGLQTEIPPLSVNLTTLYEATKASGTLSAVDASDTYALKANYNVPLANISSGVVDVKTLKFPWGGGSISLKPVSIPLALDKPLKLSIQLKEVELQQLLAKLGEGKVNGTGLISGTLPIIYHPDGHITLQEGKAEALEAGTISVSPSLLPGENQQVQVARMTLENFHYTMLKISVSSNDANKSTIHLTLEGNNPDAFGGRPVKLNVNLAGDILPLIQQSILPFNNLKQLLELQDTP